MSTQSEPTASLRGKELMRAAVNQILAHPETWDQRHYHCGTTHCIAGHCQIIGGKKQCDDTAATDAMEMLGIDSNDAHWLFGGGRTLSEIYGFAKAMIAGKLEKFAAGYDRDGYDRAGYDRAGYNRDGYNRDGYDRAGYDRDGYNRDGYDRAGYDRDGYNRDGYDRAGSKLELLPL